ncbi:hypothetical protein HanIR_Chr15g0784681 [Helianthus annuus]|nr:hypothetical protein HanIR_Chr15g0784681 [Helianthus annuus]
MKPPSTVVQHRPISASFSLANTSNHRDLNIFDFTISELRYEHLQLSGVNLRSLNYRRVKGWYFVIVAGHTVRHLPIAPPFNRQRPARLPS